jgi:cold shock CspA family protein
MMSLLVSSSSYASSSSLRRGLTNSSSCRVMSSIGARRDGSTAHASVLTWRPACALKIHTPLASNHIFCPYPGLQQHQQQLLFRRHFSSSTDDSNHNDSAQHPHLPYITGTVKFYLRDKLYGFIIPDDPMEIGGHNEVWFHRSGIQSSYSYQESPARPYLRQRERVKFRLLPREPVAENQETNGKLSATAVDIVYENGRLVPLFRQK